MESKKFCCEKCVYRTNTKQFFNTHLLSKRHIDLNDETKQKYKCETCKKPYKSYMGLWKHKKVCIVVEDNIDNLKNEIIGTNEITISKQLLVEILEKQTKLENIVEELQNKPVSNTLINGNNNNINIVNNITILNTLYP